MHKRWHDGGWFHDIGHDAFYYVPGGEYDDGVSISSQLPEGTIVLPRLRVPALIECLEREGYITPRLDERLRAEDLKITHRLLDLLDSKVKSQ